ncbi:hypothetical protein ACIGCK_06270 [Microbacterium sp. NPDC078428]|uniref:hypothetical protein n=1 Tax=Microbacterium sp. NPDC078428 TaxID=3364190 RepID=UPI0037CAD632
MPARLDVARTDLGLVIDLVSDDGDTLHIHEPIIAEALGSSPTTRGYDAVDQRPDGSWTATGALTLDDGTRVVVEDTYRLDDAGRFQLHRTSDVTTQGSSDGVRIAFGTVTSVEDAKTDDWQFFIPGTMYNRNDSDGDGREDYLGTYVQDHRDDKNGLLAVLARAPRTGATFTVARTSVPSFDTAVSPEQLETRYFAQSTDIGSLGLAPADAQVALRGSFPFSEEYSFCLDTDGRGWAAYAPNAVGRVVDVDYEFRITRTPDLTEAIWELFLRQGDVLGTTRPNPDVTLEESLEYRQLLTQLYYRKWEREENEKEPAGYLVHFSPRTGETLGSLIEFGFSGDQTLLAYAQTIWGQKNNTPLYVQRAKTVFDFFVDHCQLPNGFSHGIFDPINDTFTHWFTGILMPFQYAEDEEDVRRYVGRQIAGALMPVARELRDVEGNYLRTMCESVYPLLLAYEATGSTEQKWLQAGTRFGDFLLNAQHDDGSWYRAYTPAGEGLTSPTAWFGASYEEQKSGTIFPVPVLTTLYRITGEEKYRHAAAKAADFIIETFVDPVLYVGGLNDTTHIKSVKSDSVGVMFLMRSLLKAYEITQDVRHLAGAVKAAKILASWVYLWDVPFPEGTLLDQARFRSTGWAVCDVIASGTYLDNEFLEFTGDLANVAVLAGSRELLDVAELVQYGMQYATSTPTNDHGYVAPGIQCEGVLTSYWLSAPDTTEFSGAVNKVKGDDNDTCNALTNGQAAYGIYDLERSFGTLDFDVIRRERFPS